MNDVGGKRPRSSRRALTAAVAAIAVMLAGPSRADPDDSWLSRLSFSGVSDQVKLARTLLKPISEPLRLISQGALGGDALKTAASDQVEAAIQRTRRAQPLIRVPRTDGKITVENLLGPEPDIGSKALGSADRFASELRSNLDKLKSDLGERTSALKKAEHVQEVTSDATDALMKLISERPWIEGMLEGEIGLSLVKYHYLNDRLGLLVVEHRLLVASYEKAVALETSHLKNFEANIQRIKQLRREMDARREARKAADALVSGVATLSVTTGPAAVLAQRAEALACAEHLRQQQAAQQQAAAQQATAQQQADANARLEAARATSEAVARDATRFDAESKARAEKEARANALQAEQSAAREAQQRMAATAAAAATSPMPSATGAYGRPSGPFGAPSIGPTTAPIFGPTPGPTWGSIPPGTQVHWP